jgi:hypothetical protein
MKIFIGWSGNAGREIGKALRMWLLGLLPQIKSLFSPELPKGQPWFAALAEVIREAEAAIVCVTPRALESHWPAFEAGAVWNAARGLRAPSRRASRRGSSPSPSGSIARLA